MRRVTTKRELRAALTAGNNERRVLVPTMGALHAGHAALLRQARELAGSEGVVVASVFLNPTQFDNAGDLSAYPRTPEEDVNLCAECGVDILFMPEPQEMYRADRSLCVEETQLSRVLCGASRPGHFAGVCLVVSKLFNLVQPTDAIFGKKDYQQLAILRRMVRDLDFPIVLHGADIVREKDGLAVSSRNVRLTPEHRAAAPAIYASLLAAAESFARGASPVQVSGVVRAALERLHGVRVDYAELVDAETLQPYAAGSSRPALLAVAAWFGEVRLIDNIELPLLS
ncbi:MAG: pantoate--beta-alanine ligase [Akkermansiaceae bacterium]|nr:pantoate--beta-alanine ligase [Akkermansiaceae bacterium]